jgi:crotonobetainyl-CoA:carnitine CoA-transferase CaiB-like acyl-CoA transferase
VREYFALRSEALAQKTTAEWVRILNDADIPAMPYHTLESLVEDPHLQDVGFLRTIDHPTEGKIYDIKPPNTLSCGTRRDYLPAPKVGQHSREILLELGYEEEEIREMVASGTTIDGRLQESCEEVES